MSIESRMATMLKLTLQIIEVFCYCVIAAIVLNCVFRIAGWIQ